MQINLHPNLGNYFTAYSNNSVTINAQNYFTNIIVSQSEVKPLTLNNIQDLSVNNLKELLLDQPDLILFGTSSEIKHPGYEILLYLQKINCGFECMSIPALCRTFNYLIGEERKVLAFIIL